MRKPILQIVFTSELDYFRNAVLGIHRYVFETEQFELAYTWMEHELNKGIQKLVDRDQISGIITVAHHKNEEQKYLDLSVPVVNVSNAVINPQLHVVTQDDFRAGELAAQHLIECGCQHFAVWGMVQRKYSIERVEGFKSKLKNHHVYTRFCEQDHCDPKLDHDRISSFLKELPSHTGVFAVLDSYAIMFLRTAKELGRSIPDDLAILGAGDDSFITQVGPIPLSSISFPSFEIGYEAAALMDKLIKEQAKHKEKQYICLHPSKVIPRKSTNALHHKDKVVRKAQQFIRDNSDATIEEIIRFTGVSRSGLQSKFKSEVGRTLLQEIHRVRINKAIHLLQHTQLTLDDISEKVGFKNVQRMFAAFRKYQGKTPGKIRDELTTENIRYQTSK